MTPAKIYLNDGGDVSGPFGLQEIKLRLDNGSLNPAILGKPEGSTAWAPLVEVLGLQTAALELCPPALPVTRTPAIPPPLPLAAPLETVRACDAQGRPYAGFWIRLCAYLIDGVILYLPNQLILLFGRFHFPQTSPARFLGRYPGCLRTGPARSATRLNFRHFRTTTSLRVIALSNVQIRPL